MGYKMKADTQISSLFRRPTASGEKLVVSGRIKGGNPTKITIGYCSIINVTEARKIAKQHLAEMARGINPNHRNEVIAAKGKTLQEALDQYLQEKGQQLKPNTVRSYTGTINRNFSGWLNRPIAFGNDVYFYGSSSFGSQMAFSPTKKVFFHSSTSAGMSVSMTGTCNRIH